MLSHLSGGAVHARMRNLFCTEPLPPALCAGCRIFLLLPPRRIIATQLCCLFGSMHAHCGFTQRPTLLCQLPHPCITIRGSTGSQIPALPFPCSTKRLQLTSARSTKQACLTRWHAMELPAMRMFQCHVMACRAARPQAPNPMVWLKAVASHDDSIGNGGDGSSEARRHIRHTFTPLPVPEGHLAACFTQGGEEAQRSWESTVTPGQLFRCSKGLGVGGVSSVQDRQAHGRPHMQRALYLDCRGARKGPEQYCQVQRSM